MKKTILSIIASATIMSQGFAGEPLIVEPTGVPGGITILPELDGIHCERDARPVDGLYESVTLLKGEAGYNLTHTIITPGFGSPVESITETLATDLECNLDGLIAYCFKSSVATGDPSNSIVKFAQQERLELNSLNQVGAQAREATIEISVGSPLFKELRKNFSYRASACRSN